LFRRPEGPCSLRIGVFRQGLKPSDFLGHLRQGKSRALTLLAALSILTFSAKPASFPTFAKERQDAGSSSPVAAATSAQDDSMVDEAWSDARPAIRECHAWKLLSLACRGRLLVLHEGVCLMTVHTRLAFHEWIRLQLCHLIGVTGVACA